MTDLILFKDRKIIAHYITRNCTVNFFYKKKNIDISTVRLYDKINNFYRYFYIIYYFGKGKFSISKKKINYSSKKYNSNMCFHNLSIYIWKNVNSLKKKIRIYMWALFIYNNFTKI